MNREKKGPLGRAAVAAAALFAVLASALVLTGALASPAQAATPQYGYAKPTAKESYLKYHVARGAQILYVDTEHADPDGFWFAAESAFHERSFGWVYQPYGMWCGTETTRVVFNEWMNTHWCSVDRDAITRAAGPAWGQNTDACRAATGLPWKNGSRFAGDTGCGDSDLDWNSTPLRQNPSAEKVCAPWEARGLTPGGAPKCSLQRYSWENGPANTFWAPAPDTCTGMPASANKSQTSPNPANYVPASGDGSCTGEAFAPNCSAANANRNHQACTGVPEPEQVWATATATATATGVSATAAATKTVNAKAVRAKVTKSAKKRYRGRLFKASATVKIMKSRSAARTATITVSNGTAAATATMSCSAADLTAARACAQQKAKAEAQRLANANAQSAARTRAQAQAQGRASAQARSAAIQAAAKAPVTGADKRKAGQQAKKQAVKKVNRQIRNARRR